MEDRVRLRFTVGAGHEGCRLGGFLRGQGVSVSLLRSLKYTDCGICVNDVRAHTNLVLQAGDVVCLTLPEDEVVVAPERMPLNILYESMHAMVVDKPAGLVVHPTRSHPGGTLANGFAGLMDGRSWRRAFRPVGRLDGDTSGLVLCAMNAWAAPLLQKNMRKTYYALASGHMPEEGLIDLPLGPAENSVIRQCVRSDGKPARTAYTTLALGRGFTLAQVSLGSGRTHQIRAHFAHIGHPLLGDGLYGGDDSALSRHGLHCGRLEFTEPTGGIVWMDAALPSDMQATLEAGGVDKWAPELYNTIEQRHPGNTG